MLQKPSLRLSDSFVPLSNIERERFAVVDTIALTQAVSAIFRGRTGSPNWQKWELCWHLLHALLQAYGHTQKELN